MKANLMYEDQDFEVSRALPDHHGELVEDLELTTLFEAMAGGDAFLFEVSKRAVLSSLRDPEAIRYRQQVLDDCLAHPEVLRDMYAIALEAMEGAKSIYFGWFRRYPSAILYSSVQALQLFAGLLRRLRHLADDHAADFRSEGLCNFFTRLARELGDEYFDAIDEHLRRLRFRDGILLSARLGKGNKGAGYVLRTPGHNKRTLKERIGIGPRSSYSFEISPRDEAGARALSQLTDRGTNLVANALAQSTDHILAFFTAFRSELGFYVSCLNLHGQLLAKGEPVCKPVPLPPGRPALSFDGLYDACLTLKVDRRVVGNGADADGKMLVMITGANSGGKSTFLRSVGLAQLMMQCGMFVGGESFRANVCDGLFTHFIREEDASMSRGRLEDELSRMSAIADQLRPGCILLCNESLAATNEREGSEIARQVVGALMEAGIKVCYVTHLFDLAESLHSKKLPTALFLRAERQAEGTRTFKVIEAPPLATSFGQDLYQRIGGWTTEPAGHTADTR